MRKLIIEPVDEDELVEMAEWQLDGVEIPQSAITRNEDGRIIHIDSKWCENECAA